jgi:hypothetical protein
MSCLAHSPHHVDTTNVTVTLPSKRDLLLESGSRLSLEGSLRGHLRIETVTPLSAIGLTGKAFAYSVRFEFEANGQRLIYTGEVSPFDLLFRSAEHVSEQWPEFVASTGSIHWLHDGRDDIALMLPDGSSRTVRVKYMGTTYTLMQRELDVVVECRYYDSRNFADYRVVFYRRSLAELLFLPAPKYWRNSSGAIEDWDAHGAPFVPVLPR